jgi:phospholipid/cholesterol/gamma-HCH transport system substrate-binding protein
VRGSTLAGRLVALIAVAVTAIVVVMLLSGGDDGYEVTAEFQNASQLVPGNQVMVGGTPAGSVSKIELGDSGQALVTFTVDEEFAPLPRGTTATVRQGSLSSIAGRQVQLTLPPSSDQGEEIADGGTMTQAETVSAVDLDEIFNTLDTKTVKDFKRVIKGFAESYEGVAKQANSGFRYANPFLSTSRRVFGELTRDTRAFEQLIVDGARLSGALAERRADISQLVSNANLALGAIGRERAALARAIELLPPFMRQANTTFVNLRTTLTDLNPLVSASIPVAERLGPFFSEFRAAADDAVPTITDLDQIVRRPGSGNDLVELTRSQVPLARAGVGSGAPDCGSNPSSDFDRAADGDFSQGGLGEAVCALRNGLPQLAQLRAYTPELTGWFDDFSKSGVTDTNGGLGRVASLFNAFSLQFPLSPGVPNLAAPLDPADVIGGGGGNFLDIGNNARCPGSLERDPGDGSAPFTDGGNLDCDPDQMPTGP